MENERVMKVTQCFKCLGYGHIQDQCTEITPTCSECSSTLHTWRECPNQIKKCPQCDGPHRAFSTKCPKRRQAAKDYREEKERKEEENKIKPFSNVIQKSTAVALQASQKTFSDIVKSTINQDIITQSAKTAAIESQETLTRNIEEIMDKRLNDMKKEIAELRNEIKQTKQYQNKITRIYLANETHSSVALGYLYAHFRNIATPGSFKDELDNCSYCPHF